MLRRIDEQRRPQEPTPQPGQRIDGDLPARTPRHDQLAAGECLCTYCPARCCRYFALPLETPTSREDFEYIRWFLFHERVAVFVEEGSWYVLVYTDCKHLGHENLCRIYSTRPKVCRDYSAAKCEYEETQLYEQYFQTSEQIEEYAEAVLGGRRGRVVRSPRPRPSSAAAAAG